jgi:hypothetical protein
MEKGLEYMVQIYKTQDRKVFVFKCMHFYANGKNWQCICGYHLGSGMFLALQNS